MKQILPKEAPIRLEQQDYQKLREQVLRRDGWRCQLCGSMTNLEVHHKQFRSHAGEDDEQNLITLCFNCHSSAHGQDVGPKSGIKVAAKVRPKYQNLTYSFPGAGPSQNWMQ